MKLIVIFILLNIANVIIQTVKSIATIKCGKGLASLVNAVAYGLYTVVVVYTVCELPLWFKVVVVAVSNLIGVYVVKFFEEKKEKDKLWKIEVTAQKKDTCDIINFARNAKIPCNYIDIEEYCVINLFCSNKIQSESVKGILKNFDVKYFVSESKTL